MPGIDNWAHAGGFAGGYLAGIWLDPLKPERMDHMVSPPSAWCERACVIASVIVSMWPIHHDPLLRRSPGHHRLKFPKATPPPDRYFEYRSMIRSIPRRHTAQNPTRSRVNMMQSACGR